MQAHHRSGSLGDVTMRLGEPVSQGHSRPSLGRRDLTHLHENLNGPGGYDVENSA
jgi:hypothetical protein